MKVTVIGGGSWGLALSTVLHENTHDVLVYDTNQAIVDKINRLHICYQLNADIPKQIHATNDILEAVNYSDVLLFVVPTKVVRSALQGVNTHLNTPKLFINAAKGIEPETFMRMSEVFYDELNADYIKGFVALSGPSHAEEVIQKMTTLITAASRVEADALYVQHLFHNQDFFRVYSSTDLKGVELGGALKNIFALASGLIAGKGLGDNARAALITRGLVEMRKIYEAYGANIESLLGLTGIGDLVVTCTSQHSRNYQAGYKIGHGKDLEATLDSMTMVVEGIRTCEAAFNYGKQHKLDLPIINAIYTVIFDKVDPEIAYQTLFERRRKKEL
ncbi:MAG: NAD(P)-dependent glycerol-3-phosphate dehydrogenase [Candidatus Izimaplasma sp.]|nr:NAD(P)-dependent glycerol-3-phosphate dehydrogenase [Candidatus Izimaplasma bacterium]